MPEITRPPTYFQSLRLRARLTREEVTAMTGLSKNTVGLLDRGEVRPKDGTLFRAAQAFDCDPVELRIRAQADYEAFLAEKEAAEHV